MAVAAEGTNERRLTIGAMRERLAEEFPDISISKIRYLEGRGLLAPRRTRSGYRLYSEDDVDRLRTILRLQRDEFLPLRVIRDELASPGAKRRARRRSADALLAAREPHIDRRTLCERSGTDAAFVRELEEYGILEPAMEDGERRYPERDADVAAACARLARYGIEPRNLRSIRNGASSAAGLLEQIVAPALRSRNPERRLAGIEDLEALAAASQELSQLLFWRALRSLV
ncbi:MAG: MerR family transcriptional regulator [Actinomycetota bacterium]|nr:MerR family transcriptional regulator [Actinomycetota bacterium]